MLELAKSIPKLLLTVLTCMLMHSIGVSQQLDPKKELTQYTLDSWSDEQGLISGGSQSIFQSHDGYIWLGTFNGIFRFDGVDFKHFNKSNTPQIYNNVIEDVYQAKNGLIWAGSNGGGAYVFDNGLVTNFTIKDGLSSNIVLQIYEDRAGRILMGTGNGLTIYQDSSFTTYNTFTQQLNTTLSVSVSALYEDTNGTQWIGTNKGLYKFINNEFVHVPLHGEEYGDIEVLGIIENHDQELYVGTYGNGVFKIKDNQSSHFPLPDNINKVNNLLVDSNGSLWISHQNGLFRYHKGKFSALPSTSGTFEDSVEEVIEDREGSIWITRYNGGIERLRDGIFNNYTTYEGLSDNTIHSIFEDNDGSKWIGTVNGLNHFKNGEFSYYNVANGYLLGNLVRDVYRDSKGVLWVATYNGLTSVKNDRVQHYTTKNGLSSNLVRLVFEDSNGLLWFGTRNGLNSFQDGVFTNYTTDNGLSHNFILSILERVPGELWIGTSGGGIAILKDGKFSKITTEDGLPSNVVFRIYQDNDNVLWITTNNGLCRFDGELFAGFNSENGFLNAAVFQVLEDSKGQFWVTSDFGIIKVKKSDLNQYVKNGSAHINEISYKQVDGLKRSECTGAAASLKSRDNTLWFATLGGVAVVDVNDSLSNEIPPSTLIEKLTVDQQPFVLKKHEVIQIPQGAKNLEIKYTGLSLKVPQRVRFKYQLIGYDDDWVDPGTRRTAYYTSLPPGNYTFRVIASNNDGLWSKEPSEISFYIAPKFHQTAGFYFISAIVALLLLLGVYNFRVRIIKKEQIRLKQLVAERTCEIQAQNEEIATQRDKIEERSKKLEEAHEIIEEQNQQLKKSNIVLEDTVQIRTAQLEISNFKLKEKNKELDLFIYKSAHDLKGPIARMLGLCLLGLTDNDPEAEKIYFKKLENTATNMNFMLSRIIRIHEINVKEIDIAPIGVQHLVNSIFRDSSIAKELIDNKIDPKLTLHSDEYLVKIVLENLISNAYKFRNDDDQNQFIRIDASKAGHDLELSVGNKGPIIPAEFHDKIFDIFTVATDNIEGTGLGLYETKVIMDKLEGAIELYKSDEESTVFKITFRDNMVADTSLA